MQLGKVNIFFGKVKSVADDENIFRCRIAIDGYTAKLSDDELPWYYPFYGVNFLPQENDEVPVLIFDGDFTTAFYGRKVDLSSRNLDSGDYADYLELYKRGNVSLTYKPSTGIEFVNDTSKVQIEVDKLSFFVDTNSIVVTKDRIDIGNANQEASMLGDKTVKHLQNIIKHQNNTISNIFQIFTAIASAAGANPMTSPIGAAITPLVASLQPMLVTENKKVNTETNTLQSKKVYIE